MRFFKIPCHANSIRTPRNPAPATRQGLWLRKSMVEEIQLEAGRHHADDGIRSGIIETHGLSDDGCVAGRTGLSTWDRAYIESLIRYALSLPVSTAVIGMPKVQYIDQNIAVIKSFKPLSEAEMKGLREQVATQRINLERFFT